MSESTMSRYLAIVLALGGCLNASRADGTTTLSEGPHAPSVSVDLAGGTLANRLPFDTPFLITGIVPPNIKTIQVAWCDLTPKSHKWCNLGVIQSEGDSTIVCSKSNKHAHQSEMWRQIESVPQTSFSLNVDTPLPVDHEFRFYFRVDRTLTDKEKADFRARFKPAAEAAIVATANKWMKNDGEIATLTGDSLTSVETMAEGALQKIPVLDDEKPRLTRDPFDDPQNSWSARFQIMADTLLHRKDALTRFEQHKNAAQAALIEWQKALQGIYGPLNELSVQDSVSFDKAMPGKIWEALKRLVVLNADELSALVVGRRRIFHPEAHPEGKVEPRDAWNHDELAPTLDNLRATSASTEEIREYFALEALGHNLKDIVSMGQAQDLVDKTDAAKERIDKLVSALESEDNFFAERDAVIAGFVDRLTQDVEDVIVINGTTTGTFYTRAKDRVSLDIGFAYAPGIEEALPYFGTNFYPCPVNREVALGATTFKRSLPKRVSFLLGLTLNSIKKDVEGRTVRDDLFNSSAVLAGAGIRFTDYARFSIGAIVFKENRRNPLIDRMDVAADVFASVSFDWDIAPLLGKIGKLFPR